MVLFVAAGVVSVPLVAGGELQVPLEAGGTELVLLVAEVDVPGLTDWDDVPVPLDE